MNQKSKPKLKVHSGAIDHFLNLAGVLGLLVMFGLLIRYYGDLPESVPRHYNLKGEADAYGHKSIIWIYPFIALFLFLILKALSLNPHLFNYPVAINNKNAQQQYNMAVRMLKYLSSAIVWIFTYICWVTIYSGLGHPIDVGPYFLYIFILMIFAPLVYYLFLAKRTKGN